MRSGENKPPPPLVGGGWGGGLGDPEPLPPTPSLKGRGRLLPFFSFFPRTPVILTPMGTTPVRLLLAPHGTDPLRAWAAQPDRDRDRGQQTSRPSLSQPPRGTARQQIHPAGRLSQRPHNPADGRMPEGPGENRLPKGAGRSGALDFRRGGCDRDIPHLRLVTQPCGTRLLLVRLLATGLAALVVALVRPPLILAVALLLLALLRRLVHRVQDAEVML